MHIIPIAFFSKRVGIIMLIPPFIWSYAVNEQHSIMEIDHEIFSMVILTLQLIQEG